jgi:hypothetical protein
MQIAFTQTEVWFSLSVYAVLVLLVKVEVSAQTRRRGAHMHGGPVVV